MAALGQRTISVQKSRFPDRIHALHRLIQKHLFLWSLLLPALFVSGCQETQINADQPITISIAGATAMRPVLVDLSAEFSRQYPNVTFNIMGGDSSIGEERIRLAQVDLAASTLISPAIASELTIDATSTSLIRIPIGLDGLAIVTHATNPIKNLTLTQLQALYRGRIWNWQELAGNDEAVRLVTREDGSGSRALFDERIMGKAPVALTAVVMPTTDGVIDHVARNPGAIGYVSRAFVLDLLEGESGNSQADASAISHSQADASAISPRASRLNDINLIQVETQLPTAEMLQTQSYFLIQPLYLVSNGQPRAVVKQFVDFTLSPAGQAIVRRYHQPIR